MTIEEALRAVQPGDRAEYQRPGMPEPVTATVTSTGAGP